MKVIQNFILGNDLSEVQSTVRLIVLICLISLLVYVVLSKGLNRVIKSIGKQRNRDLSSLLNRSHLLLRSLGLIVCFVILIVTADQEGLDFWFTKSVSILLILQMLYAAHNIGQFIDSVYKEFDISRTRPITSIIQVIEIILCIIGGIWIVSIVTGQNTGNIMVSVSAIFAALSFVFKDTILNFLAGVQLTSSDTLQIGDRISMGDSIDGNVETVNLNSVRVRNFDQTNTIIPASRLMNEPFTNFRHIETLSVRRFNRTITIDIKTVNDASPEMIAFMKNRNLYQEGYSMHSNLYLFREYVFDILNNHHDIAHEQSLSVTIKDPTPTGIPLQITGFTNSSNYAKYELTVRDLMDQFLLNLKTFGLEVFQNPTGSQDKG